MTLANLFRIIIIISVLVIPRGALGCYNSIFNFGDSISDTGNFFLNIPPGTSLAQYPFLLPPYGETFFHPPSGRCSNGRLIIDFIAEFLGLPLLTPYLEVKNNLTLENFKRGVNFAVIGATALDPAFLEEMGCPPIVTNCSLRVQMSWFKDMLVSLCNTSSPSECSRQLLSGSLISMGGIGSNDSNRPLMAGALSVEQILSYLPLVFEEIASAIKELIELGASTIWVPGAFPNGCLPAYLTTYENSTADKYNTTTGCINWLNDFEEYYNERLQLELSQIRSLHPNVNLIYLDYYHAMLQLIESPEQFGFNSETKFLACCGGGGRYNYNSSAVCGSLNASTTVCENQTQFISWDGAHSTEAGYRWVAKGILEGKHTFPPNHISNLCVSQV